MRNEKLFFGLFCWSLLNFGCGPKQGGNPLQEVSFAGDADALKEVCMQIHKTGFRNGWKDHPRTLHKCQQRLIKAGMFINKNKIKGDFLAKLSQCLDQNDDEDIFQTCLGNFAGAYYADGAEKVLLQHVAAIKTAEIQYESAYSSFVSCDEYPHRSSGLKTEAWVVGSSGGFEVLNWRPDGEVRGSYSVKTTGSGGRTDFTVIGVIDIDGDGEFTTYTATKSTQPTKVISNKK